MIGLAGFLSGASASVSLFREVKRGDEVEPKQIAHNEGICAETIGATEEQSHWGYATFPSRQPNPHMVSRYYLCSLRFMAQEYLILPPFKHGSPFPHIHVGTRSPTFYFPLRGEGCGTFVVATDMVWIPLVSSSAVIHCENKNSAGTLRLCRSPLFSGSLPVNHCKKKRVRRTLFFGIWYNVYTPFQAS